MKPFLLHALSVSTWVAVQAQVVQWDMQKLPLANRIRRRQSRPFEEVIDNNLLKGGYFCTVSVGTPGQTLSIQLDTGSSDVWLPWSGAEVCADRQRCDLGSFDYEESSTFVDVASGRFSISYVDGSSAQGDYIADSFEIGGITLDNFTMGLAITTNIPYGLAGIGFALNEASVETRRQDYPNLPVALYDEGSINSIAYSLWLNDLDANTGSLLFGGIDTEKYIGDMSRMDIITNNGVYRDFTVFLTSLIASSPSGSDSLTSNSFPIPAILDSGTSLTYLPPDLAEQVWQEVGAEYNDNVAGPVLPCSFAGNDGYFSFQFAGPDGPRINVTMDELVLELGTDSAPVFESGPHEGETVCYFGIFNSSEREALLGDTFLRSAYVVYDLVNNEIGMAATDFNSTDTNVVAFSSYGARIPSATAVPNQSEATQVPKVTQHGYTAASGFQGSPVPDGAGGAGGADNANGDDPADNPASSIIRLGPSFAVVGLTMCFMLLGGTVFFSLL